MTNAFTLIDLFRNVNGKEVSEEGLFYDSVDAVKGIFFDNLYHHQRDDEEANGEGEKDDDEEANGEEGEKDDDEEKDNAKEEDNEEEETVIKEEEQDKDELSRKKRG